MTWEEAIHELQEDKMLYETEVCHAGDGSPDGRLLEALDMAIEALQDRPKGEWIFNPTDAIDLMFAKPKCSKCGFESSDGGNFCPMCGAKMADNSLVNDITESPNDVIESQNDVIEVVRCKDCRHRDLFSCPLADNDFQKDDDYCSWGERREPLPQYAEWQNSFNKMCESAKQKPEVTITETDIMYVGENYKV